MLYWIRVERYRNKQAKTFGSQVAESAVRARLQPLLLRDLGLQSSGLSMENNTARAQTQYSLVFVYYWGGGLQFPVSINCLFTLLKAYQRRK